jgi:hypothetical protein
VVVHTHAGWRCRFLWRTHDHDLPLTDTNVIAAVESNGRRQLTGEDLSRALGYRPHRILVAIANPVEGICFKVAAALLPRP